jgi:galactose mutarotase-like enzyme
MVYLANGIISAEISEIGAEIKSLKKDGYEYIWSGDPRVWGKTAPVLFPIQGSLKDDKYILDGKTYEMAHHGVVVGKEFTVESATDTSVTMLYTHNEQTLRAYPFEFEFRVIFTLIGNSVQVEYRVTNLNDRDMYFSVGGHEAYATPEGIEDYDIIFPNKENLESYLLAGPLLQNITMTIGKNTEYLPLYDKYFILDTLVFKHLKSKSLVLKNRKTDRAIQVEFPDCDYLAIWHMPSAGYVCIEPWGGLPDNVDSNYDFTAKEGIVTLAPHKEYSNIHTIRV